MTEWQLTCVPQDPKYGRKPQTLIVETEDATGLIGKPIRCCPTAAPTACCSASRRRESDAMRVAGKHNGDPL